MRYRTLAIVCSIVAAGAAIMLWQRPHVPQAGIEPPAPAGLARTTTATTVAGPAPQTTVAALERAAVVSDAPPDKIDAKQPFRIDPTGKLVLDEQTRLNMEALFAQTDRAHLLEAQQNATAALPPAAASEAATLLQQYDNYSRAQRQSYPPGIAPATEEAALAELEGLHALRVAHFGPEVASAFFGAEEQITRSLLDLMRLEKDQSLTLPEKAERAQKLHDEITTRQQRQP